MVSRKSKSADLYDWYLPQRTAEKTQRATENNNSVALCAFSLVLCDVNSQISRLIFPVEVSLNCFLKII